MCYESFYQKKDFDGHSLRIAKAWGPGKKEKNNGILIAFSKGQRRIRIQNGNGIEPLISDSETQNIINNYFIPGFKNSDYFKGTFDGLIAIISLLRTKLKP